MKIKKLLACVFLGILLYSIPAHSESFDIKKEIKNDSILYHVDMIDDEKVLIQDEDLMLTINQIKDHSCPKGAMCILPHPSLWEGGFEVDMEVLEGYEMKKVSHIYQENKENKLQLDDKDIEISNLKKTSDHYQLTLKVKKK